VSVVSPDQIIVSAGYFEAMGMPMVAGRAFQDSDDASHERVVIVDQRLAERFWPGRDAVGRQIVQPLGLDALKALTPENHRLLRVVGVVRDVKQHALVTPADLVGTYYFAAAQEAPASVVLAVQTANAAAAVEADLRRVVAGLDPRLPLFDVKNMRQRIDGSLSARRATMAMAVVFGVLALVLSAVGLYGVLAYLVAQRTREIGIRMALGGSARAIASLVLGESAVVVAVGIVVGIAGAAWMGRALSSQLFEVRALEPMALVASIALLVAAAVTASAAPLRRALRVDPAVTLVAE
jgi:putative ABC transport system permease protein